MSGTPETVSVAEQAAEAGRVEAGHQDAVDALRVHCQHWITAHNDALKTHNKLMALSKLEEMIFWLRAGLDRS